MVLMSHHRRDMLPERAEGSTLPTSACCTIKMYAVTVEVKSEGRGKSNTASSSATSLPASVLDAGQSSNGDIEEIQVSVGNPRVEHLTGTVHLYRQTHGRDDAGPFSAKLPVAQPAFPPTALTCIEGIDETSFR